MNNIAALERVFNYQNRRLRTVQRGGEYWFVVQDVCSALEVGNTRDAISRLVADDVDLIELVDSLGRRQEMRIINEAGLYTLVLGSRKPEAKAFGHWITHEVLPALRRSGVYRMAGAQEGEENGGLLPLSRRQLLNLALEAETECEGLRQENAELRPKADFYDAVAGSTSAIEMSIVAKTLNFIGVGRNTLFKVLRQKRILMQDNQPYQEYVDRGYFRTIEQKYMTPEGETCISVKTVVFQRGVEFVRKVLLSMGFRPQEA